MSPELDQSQLSPTSPTTERKQIRRRKRLNPRDKPDHGRDQQGRSSDLDLTDDQPTPICLSEHISLPITIVHIFVPHSLNSSSSQVDANKSHSINFPHRSQSNPNVIKTTPLFSYLEGINDPPTPSSPTDSLKGKRRAIESDIYDHPSGPSLSIYESPVKGEIVEWSIKEGMVLDHVSGWRTKPLVLIKEPCTHSVQWQGQCAICGSDLTISDYTGILETSRASIPMSHGPSTLTVSISEARRLESETRQRLLKSQKLSLIVDLDQTIVHATVDPTVGEWMSDQSNPNFNALRDVGKFQLYDGPNIGHDGCYYYLKMRPGLKTFLHTLAEKYEMHVYTMGTRAYADAVCRIIDPTGELFGSRVLSRDESGSMTQKSLTRLFPVDTSMVVIIDDRGDVWEYSPNLVSVVPYNFFVGIGDINGAFLPPARQLQSSTLEGTTPPNSTSLTPPTMTLTNPSGSNDPVTLPDPIPSSSSIPILTSTSTDPVLPSLPISTTSVIPSGNLIGPTPISTTASNAQSKLLTDQLIGRPLKQKQIELEESRRSRPDSYHRRINSVNSSISNASDPSSHDDIPLTIHDPDPSSETKDLGTVESNPQTDEPIPRSESSDPKTLSLNPSSKDQDPPKNGDETVEGTSERVEKLDGSEDNLNVGEQAVLVDRDTELKRLESILSDVHSGFYSQDVIEQADVREVISALKHDVLQGIHLAFSGLWPMDAIPDQQDAWKLAEQFGAHCYTKLTPRVTHLVAAKLGTSKVTIALTHRNLSVVKPTWLYDAVTLWKHPIEEDYLWRKYEESIEGPELEIEDDHDGWGIEMKSFDWKDANEEVMAAMEESSEEDDEEEMIKRDRGITGTGTDGDSPISKRQKLVRSRTSRLKDEIGGDSDDLESDDEEERLRLMREEDEFLSALAAEMEGEMDHQP